MLEVLIDFNSCIHTKRLTFGYDTKLCLKTGYVKQRGTIELKS